MTIVQSVPGQRAAESSASAPLVRWLAVVGCTIGQAISNGPLLFTTFGLFLVPMTTELGWTRTQFSLDFSIASLSTALVLPLVGFLVDRVGSKKVIWVAVVVFPAIYACYGLVTSYSAFLIIAFCAGAAGALTALPTYLAILPGWFDRRLGLVFGIGAAGTGLGSMVIPFVANSFIHGSDWRHAFFYMALLIAVVGLINTAFFIRENRGPLPTAEQSRGASETNNALSGVAFGEAVRSGAFWSLTIAFALVIFVTLGVNFHFVALMQDRGYTALEGAAAVSLVGTTALVARLGTGILLDYFSMRILGLVFFVGQAIASLLLISGAGGFVPYVAAVLLGAAQGAEGDLLPYSLSRRFGRKAYGAIYALAFAVFNLGQLLSPPILGAAFDRLGSYMPVLMAFPVISLIAAFLVFFTRVPRPPLAAA